MKLEIDEKNFKMNGVPASAGEVVGRACVIKTLDEINELQTGTLFHFYITTPDDNQNRFLFKVIFL